MFYLDGSGGSRSSDARIRRCGWAAVLLDFDNGKTEFVGACFGGLPGADQVVPRSELQAASQALKATGTSKVWFKSDSSYVVDLYAKSRNHSLLSINGDLWEEFWNLVDSKNGDVSISKVKAHCSVDEINAGIISWRDFEGNMYADKFADKGAEENQLSYEITSSIDVMDSMAWRVQERLAAIICANPTKLANKEAMALAKKKKAEKQKEKAQEGQRAQEEAAEDPDNSGKADVLISAEAFFDSVKLQLEEKEAKRLRGEGDEARQSDHPQRVDRGKVTKVGGERAQDLHSSHSLAYKQGIHWCWKCGKYASTRGRELLKPCPGAPTPAGEAVLRRLRNGQTPKAHLNWTSEDY